MGKEPVLRVEEFDRMTPQERADAVVAGIVRSWDDVSPECRARLAARADEIEGSRASRG